jgi:hypothetical protein
LGFQHPVDDFDDAEVAVCIGREVRAPPHIGIGGFDNITVPDGLQYLDWFIPHIKEAVAALANRRTSGRQSGRVWAIFLFTLFQP